MRYLIIFLISLAVTLGGLVAYQKFLLPKHIKKVYVVDTDKIIAVEKKKLFNAAKNKDEEEFKKVLNQDKIYQKAIEYIAKRDNAVVFAKKAVIAGYDKDITNEVFSLVDKAETK